MNGESIKNILIPSVLFVSCSSNCDGMFRLCCHVDRHISIVIFNQNNSVSLSLSPPSMFQNNFIFNLACCGYLNCVHICWAKTSTSRCVVTFQSNKCVWFNWINPGFHLNIVLVRIFKYYTVIISGNLLDLDGENVVWRWSASFRWIYQLSESVLGLTWMRNCRNELGMSCLMWMVFILDWGAI